MWRFAISGMLLYAMMFAGWAQEKPVYVAKRCVPKIVANHDPRPNHESITFRKGEKSTGRSPLIAFEILESGEVVHVYVKGSSGFADIDRSALNWTLVLG
jgi:hypothetical protein